MTFRPFSCIYSPTIACEWEGVMLYTIPECREIGLATREAIPCYILESSEYAAVVMSKEMKWEPVGTFTLPIDGWRKEGTHLPDAIVEEFREWCNEFTKAHPITPCIEMMTVTYVRNNYKSYNNCLYTYNQLKAER